MDSNQGGNIFSRTQHVGTRAGIAATPAKRMYKTTSEKNKQFDPGGKGEKALLWNATVILFFSGESVGPWEAHCLCFVFSVCALCVPVCSVL